MPSTRASSGVNLHDLETQCNALSELIEKAEKALMDKQLPECLGSEYRLGTA